jgi:hypothetical protein
MSPAQRIAGSSDRSQAERRERVADQLSPLFVDVDITIRESHFAGSFVRCRRMVA